ncbi:hypothetical protein DFP72DRAFT_861383 [Ephemerocybe angulata]|uniref:Uncharacterized protein n=1 Tax=Ephemerocybe angulata TaxID=980116 RepID=A0A8H6H8J3_9AGAR|nr:hypothetical protein DFP72DRAFT_861383 [Tulosesus angulatus]
MHSHAVPRPHTKCVDGTCACRVSDEKHHTRAEYRYVVHPAVFDECFCVYEINILGSARVTASPDSSTARRCRVKDSSAAIACAYGALLIGPFVLDLSSSGYNESGSLGWLGLLDTENTSSRSHHPGDGDGQQGVQRQKGSCRFS